MSLLHAYGCSWTEGEGFNLKLESTLKNQNLKIERNNHSWVKLLADKLNVVAINNGKSGNSNNVIFNSVVQDIKLKRIKEKDLVVIMWSSTLRDYLPFFPKGEWVSWSLKSFIDHPDKFIKSYKSEDYFYDGFLTEYKKLFLTELYTQDYINIINQNYIIFLQKIFEYYNIKYLMCDAFDSMIDQNSESIKNYNKINFIDKKFYWRFDENITMKTFLHKNYKNSLNCDLSATDHPNEIGYKVMADEIYNFLKTTYESNQ